MSIRRDTARELSHIAAPHPAQQLRTTYFFNKIYDKTYQQPVRANIGAFNSESIYKKDYSVDKHAGCYTTRVDRLNSLIDTRRTIIPNIQELGNKRSSSGHPFIHKNLSGRGDILNLCGEGSASLKSSLSRPTKRRHSVDLTNITQPGIVSPCYGVGFNPVNNNWHRSKSKGQFSQRSGFVGSNLDSNRGFQQITNKKKVPPILHAEKDYPNGLRVSGRRLGGIDATSFERISSP